MGEDSKMTDARLPAGLVVMRVVLESTTGAMDWFRVVDSSTGRLVGAGFDERSAVEDARRELERRRENPWQ